MDKKQTWDSKNNRRANICVIGVPEEEEKGYMAETLFKEIMAVSS